MHCDLVEVKPRKMHQKMYQVAVWLIEHELWLTKPVRKWKIERDDFIEYTTEKLLADRMHPTNRIEKKYELTEFATEEVLDQKILTRSIDGGCSVN